MRDMAKQRQTTLDQTMQGKIAMIFQQKAGEMTCRSINQSHVMAGRVCPRPADFSISRCGMAERDVT